MRTNLIASFVFVVVPSVSFLAVSAACGGGNANTGGTTPSSKPHDEYAQPAATAPDSDKVTWKKDAALAKCHNDVKTGADLQAGVTAMATGCTSLTKMKQVGTPVAGSRGPLDKPQAIPLHAEAGKCYRVYGLSEDALKDLDIAITDSAGKVCAEDGSDSPDSVVLEDGSVCFKVADEANVNVAAGDGSGNFVVEIWSD
jgi:hypothetical protein